MRRASRVGRPTPAGILVAKPAANKFQPVRPRRSGCVRRSFLPPTVRRIMEGWSSRGAATNSMVGRMAAGRGLGVLLRARDGLVRTRKFGGDSFLVPNPSPVCRARPSRVQAMRVSQPWSGPDGRRRAREGRHRPIAIPFLVSSSHRIVRMMFMLKLKLAHFDVYTGSV